MGRAGTVLQNFDDSKNKLSYFSFPAGAALSPSAMAKRVGSLRKINAQHQTDRRGVGADLHYFSNPAGSKSLRLGLSAQDFDEQGTVYVGRRKNLAMAPQRMGTRYVGAKNPRKNVSLVFLILSVLLALYTFYRANKKSSFNKLIPISLAISSVFWLLIYTI